MLMSILDLITYKIFIYFKKMVRTKKSLIFKYKVFIDR